MDERAQGIVLRVHPLTETSLIIRWLTPQFGRLATAAKGARRSKSPFRGKLDLFYVADFTFGRSRRSDLHTLRELRLQETHPGLRRDLAYLRQASYGAALIEQTTEMESPVPVIFQLMDGFLRQLCQHPAEPRTIFAFELKLLNELGLRPDLAKSRFSPGAKEIVNALIRSDWSDLFRLKLSSGQTTELRQFLHGFLVFHLGKIPNSRVSALSIAGHPAHL